MQIISGPAGKVAAREIAQELGVNEIIPEFKIFPDGETYIRVPTDIDDQVLITQSCHYPQDSNLFQLLNLVHTIRDIADPEITCYIPYMCYARADRAVNPGEAVSINTVLYLLESVGIDHLITLDIHNPEVLERTEMRTTNVFPTKSVKNFLDDKNIDYSESQVVAPDEGAQRRAKLLGEELNIGSTSLQKHRNPDTGNVSLKLGDADLQSNEVILVDDIISTGGTLVEASNLLTLNGISQIHYIVTHALGTEAVDKLREIGNGVVAATNSTNSIIGKITTGTDIAQVI